MLPIPKVTVFSLLRYENLANRWFIFLALFKNKQTRILKELYLASRSVYRERENKISRRHSGKKHKRAKKREKGKKKEKGKLNNNIKAKRATLKVKMIHQKLILIYPDKGEISFQTERGGGAWLLDHYIGPC
jgi:hypothetical protein